MGGLCSRRSTEENGINYGSGVVYQTRGVPEASVRRDDVAVEETNNKRGVTREAFSFPEMNGESFAMDDNDGIPRLSRALSHKSRAHKSNLPHVTKLALPFDFQGGLWRSGGLDPDKEGCQPSPT
ncbi:hypothetical protein Tco_1341751 [Tanacetum coccineum]